MASKTTNQTADAKDPLETIANAMIVQGLDAMLADDGLWLNGVLIAVRRGNSVVFCGEVAS